MSEANNDIKLFYDLTAKANADEWYKEDILKPTIHDFISLLPNAPRVLDLGCGTGHESMRLAQAGAEVFGIDFSEECINIARARAKQCKFKIMDFCKLDNSIGNFDGIFACASLIHIKPKELHNVLSRTSKVLLKGGYLATMILEGEGIKEEWSLLEVNGKKFNRTVYLYTKRHIGSILRELGLEFIREGFLDEKLTEYGWKNYIFKKVVSS